MAGKHQDYTRIVELTPPDILLGDFAPATTTVTFFRGGLADAQTKLLHRFTAIVKANPWLAGILATQSGKVELRYPDSPTNERILDLFNPTQRDGEVRPQPEIDSTMSSSQLAEALAGSVADVLSGRKVIDTSAPLMSLSLIQDALRPGDTFALVFSMSHYIGDGFTYYKVLAMLSADSDIVAMSAARKSDFEEQFDTQQKSDASFTASGAFICNAMRGLFLGKKFAVENYLVDPARIKAEKVQGAGDDVPFVSSNDVLVSAIGNTLNARVLLMAANARGRLPDLSAEDAGNYLSSLVLGPDDYAHPWLVRKALVSSTRQPLPGTCESMWCKSLVVTNWGFPWFSEIAVDGCQQMWHLPCGNESAIPFECAVIYRPSAGQLAVIFYVRSLAGDCIKAQVPVGDAIPSAEQYFQLGSR